MLQNLNQLWFYTNNSFCQNNKRFFLFNCYDKIISIILTCQVPKPTTGIFRPLLRGRDGTTIMCRLKSFKPSHSTPRSMFLFLTYFYYLTLKCFTYLVFAHLYNYELDIGNFIIWVTDVNTSLYLINIKWFFLHIKFPLFAISNTGQ